MQIALERQDPGCDRRRSRYAYLGAEVRRQGTHVSLTMVSKNDLVAVPQDGFRGTDNALVALLFMNGTKRHEIRLAVQITVE